MNASPNSHGQTPLPALPERPPDSHKGRFGKVLLVGGSRGMTGAMALAGMAALRSGAGLVQLAVPEVSLDVVAAAEPSYMTAGLDCDATGRLRASARGAIFDLAESATAIGCGPGLGRGSELTELIGVLFARLERPAVFDADALNALAEMPERLGRGAAPRVLTPHPGEFGRLLGITAAEVQAQREKLAAEFAGRYGVVLVLKGHGTVVSDGKQTIINETGNPGMATGGTGDVLTGVIAALLAQGMEPFDAAWLGAHVHGRAGDLAAVHLGETSLIASDIVHYLPQAFRALPP